jgi:hypothetical protein
LGRASRSGVRGAFLTETEIKSVPKYTPTAEDEGLYGSVTPPDKETGVPRGTSEDKTPAEEGDTETTDEETAESQNSAVVANKVLMGPDGKAPKEGDEIVLKVVKVYGDESEVAYSTTKPTAIGASSPMSSDSEIDALDTKGMQ